MNTEDLSPHEEFHKLCPEIPWLPDGDCYLGGAGGRYHIEEVRGMYISEFCRLDWNEEQYKAYLVRRAENAAHAKDAYERVETWRRNRGLAGSLSKSDDNAAEIIKRGKRSPTEDDE